MKHLTMIAGTLLMGLGGLPIAQATELQAPTLVLPRCSEATFKPGERKCFPVMLQQGDCQAASVGFKLQYDPIVLELSDVEPGDALDPQSFTPIVDPSGGMLQVAITPPIQLPPLPIIPDGEIAKICFTALSDAPQCTILEFLAADVGDNQGQNCPMPLPGSGGIQILPVLPTLDHYQCYKAKPSRGEKFESRNVHLMDQFETRITTVIKPVALCNPADKNQEGIYDPVTHLTSYRIKDAKVCSDNGAPCSKKSDCASGAQCKAPKHLKQTNLLVKNQFGNLLVETNKAERLLVPGTKDEGEPTAIPTFIDHEVDHFKCYKVKVNKNLCEDDPAQRCKTDADCATGVCNLGFPRDLVASIEDQFTTPPQMIQVKKPTRLCNPVNKNDEGIKHGDSHLMCYQVKLLDTKHDKRSDVHIANQFGQMRLDTNKEEELCVPSEKMRIDR